MTGRWTPEDIATVKAMYLDGKTYGEITKAIGKDYTRRAISGAVRRLRQSGAFEAFPNRICDRTAKMTEIRMANKKVREESQIKKPPTRFELVGESIIPLAGVGLSLEAVSRRSECRYPYNQPGADDFYFCGLATHGDSSYCESHRKICSTPSKPSQRESLSKMPSVARLNGVFP